MAEEKDFGINLNTPLNGSDDELENINFDDVKDTGLDDFLNDVSMENQEMAFTNAKNSVQSNKNDEKDDEISKLSSVTSADLAALSFADEPSVAVTTGSALAAFASCSSKSLIMFS